MAAWTLAQVLTRGGDGGQHGLGGQAPVSLGEAGTLGCSFPEATGLGTCPLGPPPPLHMVVGFPAHRAAQIPKPKSPESQEQALAKGLVPTGCTGGQWPSQEALSRGEQTPGAMGDGLLAGISAPQCDLEQVTFHLWLQLPCL